MNVMVIAAHPDDETLGCGGTIARLSGEGHRVSVVVLGEGITSRFTDRTPEVEKMLVVLEEQARSAGACLGVHDIIFYTFPDNKFDTVPLLDIIKAIEHEIAEIQPDVIFTHHGGDLNIDHTIAHRATITAARPLSDSVVNQILMYEVPSSTEWTFNRGETAFHPGIFYNITDFLNTKIQALQEYTEELQSFPHPRSIDGIKVNALRWGNIMGVPAAEAFEGVWEIR